MKEINSSVTSFHNLLSYFDADPETAGKKYIEIQNRLLMKFEQRGCRDPYELVVATFDRVEKALARGVVIEKNIYAFIHGFANNILKEYWDSPRLREMQIPPGVDFPQSDRLPSDLGIDEKQIALERRIDCLERCLSELAPETKALFLEYYDESRGKRKDWRKGMAATLGLDLNALRQRMHRIKRELHDGIARCVKLNINNP